MSPSKPYVYHKEECGTCRFFYSSKNAWEGDGLCRRYPPKVHVYSYKSQLTGEETMQTHNAFPGVISEDWCGEWQFVKE